MLNQVTMKNSLPSGRKMTLAFLTAASLLMQVGCKDDDKIIGDGDLKMDPAAMIPTKGKKYTYTIKDDEGSSTQVTSVKSTKDSTGILVYHIENRISEGGEETVVLSKAYSQNGVTTNEVSLPAAYASILAELEGSEYVKSIKLTGFPQYQLLENSPAVGSKMTFKGDPVKMNIKMEFSDEEGNKITSEVDAAITYANGTLKKVENITTPGGTFNASKWEYSYEMITKTFINGELDEQSNELRYVSEWTAPGVGVVKSVEADVLGTQTSVTELQKID